MRFLLSCWLGILVLLALALAWFSMLTMPRNLSAIASMPFTFLLLVWLVRGFFRMAGRAWRHGATNGR